MEVFIKIIAALCIGIALGMVIEGYIKKIKARFDRLEELIKERNKSIY